MNKAQFDSIFKEEYADFINRCKKERDKVALRTAYNDFTDYMCKSGHITDKQYINFAYPFK